VSSAATSEDELAAERTMLDQARLCLTSMRERTRTLGAVGGDEYATRLLAGSLARRVASLEDDGVTPPFFGRIDRVPSDEDTGEPDSFHIGRRHIHDDEGDPIVIDWRAGVSTAFYRASSSQPMGVRLRRRFGFAAGRLTAYEDEVLVGAAAGDRASAILQSEIERPRIGPMRDIVATIQPDQDEIVRADLRTTVCVQGAPGTGKTAVGLHRAAYLLYAHRDQLRRSGVLVIGPNRAFLGYIAEVLPALGEMTVAQRSLDDLVEGVSVSGSADSGVRAELAGQSRMAEVIRRAIWSRVGTPTEAVVLPIGSRRWRVGSATLAGILEDLRAHGSRYHASRAMLPMRIADHILRGMEESGDSPDDRTLDAVARSRPVRAAVDALWPKLSAPAIIRELFSDATVLAAAAEGVYDPAEQAALLWAKPPRSLRACRWTAAEVYCIDEATDLLDRIPSVGHVILDEAQDLSAMQLRAVGRRCSTGSATVLGDLAQGTTPWAAQRWTDVLTDLGKPDAVVEVLTKGYRVPRQLIDYANRLLPVIAPDVGAAESVRSSSGALLILPGAEVVARAAALVADLDPDEGSVAVVCADRSADAVLQALSAAGLEPVDLRTADSPGRLAVVPASLAKGLEFDHVVVVEPADIAEAEPRGLRRLYVVLTRAVSALTILHERPLPAPLS
jgi:DNA helicase IV